MKKLLIAMIAVALSVAALASERDSLEISRAPYVSPEGMIMGNIPGVIVSNTNGSVTGSVETIIRGVNSMKGSPRPLWIVDGIVLNPVGAEVDNPLWEFGSSIYCASQNSLLGISQYDVESIRVLRNQSETARYGSAGADGVIIINTRAGEDDRSRIRFHSDYTGSSHGQYLSVGGHQGQARYFISGFYRDLSSSGTDGGIGGFRFNLDASAGKHFGIGMNSSVSLGNWSMANPMLPSSADYSDDARETRTSDAIYVNMRFGHNFKARAQLGVDFRSKRRYLWYGNGTLPGIEMNGAAGVSSMMLFNYNAQFDADWSRYFGKSHVAASLNAELTGNDNDYNVMSGYDFFDYALRGKGIQIASSTATIHRTGWTYSRRGAGLSASYDYDLKAGADLSCRADNTPMFGPGWTVYPSAVLWLDVFRTAGLRNGFLSALKLRGGWGRSGREVYVPYQWMDQYAAGYPSVGIDLQTFYQGRNFLISGEYNAEIELGLCRDRVRAVAGVYSKTTTDRTDLFCNGQEFGLNGFWRYTSRRKVFGNCGTLSDKGFEVELSADIIRTDALKWRADLCASFNANEILSIPALDVSVDPVAGQWIYSNVEGFPAHCIIGYSTDASGNPCDRTGDGLVTKEDMRMLAISQPDRYLSASTSLSAGRFFFEIAADAVGGFSYVDVPSLIMDSMTGGEPQKLTADYIRNADKVRLSRASASYDVPMPESLEKVSLRVSLMYSDGLPVIGYSPFQKDRSCLAGICLTF